LCILHFVQDDKVRSIVEKSSEIVNQRHLRNLREIFFYDFLAKFKFFVLKAKNFFQAE